MSDCMTQEDAMNMNNAQAIQILKPLQKMMIDQYGCPVSDAYFALGKAIESLKTNAVEVIRCEECKHNYRRTTWNHGERDKPACKFTNYVRGNDFHCGFGDRAEA